MRVAILLFLAAVSHRSAEAAGNGSGFYNRFQTIAAANREELRREGFSYMIGGGAAFATSLGFGITSDELVPKLGYSMIQALSAAAFYYGATSYYDGDRLTREADQLVELDSTLQKSQGVTPSERMRILDEMTLKALQRERERMKRTRRIRGYVALSTATSSALTMAFSKSKGTASNISLGFILLVSTVGAASDLLMTPKADKVKDLFAFEPEIGPGRVSAQLSFRW